MKTLPRGALDQWLAFDSVEPIGEQWAQTAKLASLLSQSIGLQMATAGVKSECVTEADCMPARYHRKATPKVTKKQREQSQKQQAAQLAAHFGLQKVVDGNNNQRS